MAARKKQKRKRHQAAPDDSNNKELVVDKVSKANKLPLIILFLFGSLLYVFTIGFDYALDDKLYVTHNKFTKKGTDGIAEIWKNDLLVGFYGEKKRLLSGGRYRPLSLTMHAIEYEFIGPDEEEMALKKGQSRWTGLDEEKRNDALSRMAHFGHFMNVLLYGITGVLLYLVLCKLIPPNPSKKWFFSIAFVASALFLAHPLHTEVVANVKSRDELLSFCFSLAAMYGVLSYLAEKHVKFLVLSGVCFLAGLTAKESTLVFVGVIPLSLIFFQRGSLKDNVIAIAPMLVSVCAYLLIRKVVYGDVMEGDPVPELMNQPFMHATTSERYASIIFTLGLYIKLVLFPHPLTHDYYPWHPLTDGESFIPGEYPYLEWSYPGVILSILAYLGLISYAIYGFVQLTSKNKSDIVAYGILLFLGTFIIYSNLLFSIGAFMNERFMYTPSLGVVIILAWLITQKVPEWLKKSRSKQQIALVIMVVILIGYSIKTITRSLAWENDQTLAITDAQTSTGSAKVNMAAGGSYLTLAKREKDPAEKQRMLNQGVEHLRLSLKLYPTYIQPMELLGNTYFELGNYEYSIIYFENCLKINPNFEIARNNLMGVGDQCGLRKEFAFSAKAYEALLQFEPNNLILYSKLGEVYGRDLQDYNKALFYLNKANGLSPNNSDILQKLGVVYAMTGNPQQALAIFQNANQVDPNNPRVLLNLSIAYEQLGDKEQARFYYSQALQLDPNLKR